MTLDVANVLLASVLLWYTDVLIIVGEDDDDCFCVLDGVGGVEDWRVVVVAIVCVVVLLALDDDDDCFCVLDGVGGTEGWRVVVVAIVCVVVLFGSTPLDVFVVRTVVRLGNR